jgi:hypothetical protein
MHHLNLLILDSVAGLAKHTDDTGQEQGYVQTKLPKVALRLIAKEAVSEKKAGQVAVWEWMAELVDFGNPLRWQVVQGLSRTDSPSLSSCVVSSIQGQTEWHTAHEHPFWVALESIYTPPQIVHYR